VVVNVCLNYLRRQPPETLSLDQTAGGNFSLAGALAAGHEDDPQARLEWLETKEALRAALERLPPLWRLVLALRHQEELSYQEIAAVTGLPLGTVKTYLFRARNLLRRVFSEIYGWEEDQQ
jgi:RNA polymerase sigma-70 factor (ECF subfamily)